MYSVTMTLPDLDAQSPEEAACMFFAALKTADWEGWGGVSVYVRPPEGLPASLTLPAAALELALAGDVDSALELARKGRPSANL